MVDDEVGQTGDRHTVQGLGGLVSGQSLGSFAQGVTCLFCNKQDELDFRVD